MKKVLLNAAKILMVALAFYLALRTFEYFSFRTDINFLAVRQDVLKDVFWKIAFYLHISGALLALALGSLQFWPSHRKRHPKFHQTLGKIYALGILIAAPAGLYMAFFARGGLFAQIGFVFLDLAWMISTALGVYFIAIKKDIRLHGEWMLRSYAVTFAAVTLRLWTPLLSVLFGLSETHILALVPWLSWIPNLMVAELILLYSDQQRSKLDS